MDTASTLMGLGLLLLFVAPVGFLVYNQSHKEKKRMKKMAFLAGQKGYSLDEVEHINGLSLALDKKAGKSILLRSGQDEQLQVLDLRNVAKVDLVKTDEDGKAVSALDEVREIFLLVKSKDHSDKKLIFYAEEDDPVTEKAERLNKAMNWQKRLQQFSKS